MGALPDGAQHARRDALSPATRAARAGPGDVVGKRRLLAHARRLGDFFLAGPFLEALHQFQRRFIAEVGHDKQFFKLFPEGVVKLAVA